MLNILSASVLGAGPVSVALTKEMENPLLPWSSAVNSLNENLRIEITLGIFAKQHKSVHIATAVQIRLEGTERGV